MGSNSQLRGRGAIAVVAAMAVALVTGALGPVQAWAAPTEPPAAQAEQVEEKKESYSNYTETQAEQLAGAGYSSTLLHQLDGAYNYVQLKNWTTEPNKYTVNTISHLIDEGFNADEINLIRSLKSPLDDRQYFYPDEKAAQLSYKTWSESKQDASDAVAENSQTYTFPPSTASQPTVSIDSLGVVYGQLYYAYHRGHCALSYDAGGWGSALMPDGQTVDMMVCAEVNIAGHGGMGAYVHGGEWDYSWETPQDYHEAVYRAKQLVQNDRSQFYYINKIAHYSPSGWSQGKRGAWGNDSTPYPDHDSDLRFQAYPVGTNEYLVIADRVAVKGSNAHQPLVGLYHWKPNFKLFKAEMSFTKLSDQSKDLAHKYPTADAVFAMVDENHNLYPHSTIKNEAKAISEHEQETNASRVTVEFTLPKDLNGAKTFYVLETKAPKQHSVVKTNGEPADTMDYRYELNGMTVKKTGYQVYKVTINNSTYSFSVENLLTGDKWENEKCTKNGMFHFESIDKDDNTLSPLFADFIPFEKTKMVADFTNLPNDKQLPNHRNTGDIAFKKVGDTSFADKMESSKSFDIPGNWEVASSDSSKISVEASHTQPESVPAGVDKVERSGDDNNGTSFTYVNAQQGEIVDQSPAPETTHFTVRPVSGAGESTATFTAKSKDVDGNELVRVYTFHVKDNQIANLSYSVNGAQFKIWRKDDNDPDNPSKDTPGKYVPDGNWEKEEPCPVQVVSDDYGNGGNVRFVNVPEGKYWIEEVQPPTCGSYAKWKNRSVHAVVTGGAVATKDNGGIDFGDNVITTATEDGGNGLDANEKATRLIDFTVRKESHVTFDDNSHGSIQISAKDYKDNYSLSGAEFKITNEVGQPIGNGTYTTGEDGTVTISDIPLETICTITEVKAPAHFYQAPEPKQVLFTADEGSEKAKNVANIYASHLLAPDGNGNWRNISKKDMTGINGKPKGQPMARVDYLDDYVTTDLVLIKQGGANSAEETELTKYRNNMRHTKDEQAQDESGKLLWIKTDGAAPVVNVSEGDLRLVASPTQPEGCMPAYRSNAATSKKPLYTTDDSLYSLAGARYLLYTKAENGDDTPLDEQMTDNNGVLTFKNLGIGTYYIQELEASAGYDIDPNMSPFKDDNHDAMKIQIGMGHANPKDDNDKKLTCSVAPDGTLSAFTTNDPNFDETTADTALITTAPGAQVEQVKEAVNNILGAEINPDIPQKGPAPKYMTVTSQTIRTVAEFKKRAQSLLEKYKDVILGVNDFYLRGDGKMSYGIVSGVQGNNKAGTQNPGTFFSHEHMLRGVISVAPETANEKVSSPNSDNAGNYTLEGAVYGLFPTKDCDEYAGDPPALARPYMTAETKNLNGSVVATFENVPLGNWWVKMVAPSPGYDLDRGIQYIQLREGTVPQHAMRAMASSSQGQEIVDQHGNHVKLSNKSYVLAAQDNGALSSQDEIPDAFDVVVDHVSRALVGSDGNKVVTADCNNGTPAEKQTTVVPLREQPQMGTLSAHKLSADPLTTGTYQDDYNAQKVGLYNENYDLNGAIYYAFENKDDVLKDGKVNTAAAIDRLVTTTHLLSDKTPEWWYDSVLTHDDASETSKPAYAEYQTMKFSDGTRIKDDDYRAKAYRMNYDTYQVPLGMYYLHEIDGYDGLKTSYMGYVHDDETHAGNVYATPNTIDQLRLTSPTLNVAKKASGQLQRFAAFGDATKVPGREFYLPAPAPAGTPNADAQTYAAYYAYNDGDGIMKTVPVLVSRCKENVKVRYSAGNEIKTADAMEITAPEGSDAASKAYQRYGKWYITSYDEALSGNLSDTSYSGITKLMGSHNDGYEKLTDKLTVIDAGKNMPAAIVAGRQILDSISGSAAQFSIPTNIKPFPVYVRYAMADVSDVTNQDLLDTANPIKTRVAQKLGDKAMANTFYTDSMESGTGHAVPYDNGETMNYPAPVSYMVNSVAGDEGGLSVAPGAEDGNYAPGLASIWIWRNKTAGNFTAYSMHDQKFNTEAAGSGTVQTVPRNYNPCWFAKSLPAIASRSDSTGAMSLAPSLPMGDNDPSKGKIEHIQNTGDVDNHDEADTSVLTVLADGSGSVNVTMREAEAMRQRAEAGDENADAAYKSFNYMDPYPVISGRSLLSPYVKKSVTRTRENDATASVRYDENDWVGTAMSSAGGSPMYPMSIYRQYARYGNNTDFYKDGGYGYPNGGDPQHPLVIYVCYGATKTEGIQSAGE